MALPIAFEVKPYDPREKLRKQLEAAPIEHAEALLESYEPLQQLHRTGTLRALTGALGAGNQILETAVDAARSCEAVCATRNAILLGKMLASIIRRFSRALSWQSAKHWAVIKGLSSSRPDCLPCSANSGTKSCGAALRSSIASLSVSATRSNRLRSRRIPLATPIPPQEKVIEKSLGNGFSGLLHASGSRRRVRVECIPHSAH
jgi:hypothetical protein